MQGSGVRSISWGGEVNSMPWWLQKRGKEAQSTYVGLSVGSSKMIAVACETQAEESPRLLAWNSFDLSDPSEAENGLRRFVQEHRLEGRPCRAVLSPEDYSLRLVERPANVPDEELAEATRWLVRDLVEFDVDRAQIATIAIPEDTGRARTPRMFVIAVREEAAETLCQTIVKADLDLEGIEIVESSMVALESRMPEVVAGRAVLRVGDKSSTLTISFDERLFLARSLSINASTIEDAVDRAHLQMEPDSREVLEELDPLLLEIQRSLDYYESEYGLAPASRLTLLPSKNDYAPLLPVMSEALRPLQIDTFDLDRFFQMESPPFASEQSNLVLAAGAALCSNSMIRDALVPRSFKPSKDGFGLGAVLQVTAAIVFFALSVYGWNTYRLQSELDSLAVLESQQQELQTQFDERLEAQALASVDRDPLAELNVLRNQRDQSLRALRDLEGGHSRSATSYSTLLTALARQDLEGVWLTRIEFARGGDSISLEGRTLRAEDVPRFFRQLGQEASFRNRQFQRLEVGPPLDSSVGLAFSVSTEDVSQTDGGRQ